MEKVPISAGKIRGLKALADENGRFKMMAIDQRGSLKRMLAEVLSKEADEVKYEDLAEFKRIIIKVLSPYSSATLVDPIYGYPNAIKYFTKETGLLLCSEETGGEKAGKSGKEIKSSLISDWTVEKTKRTGANAVKLLIYYRGDASPDVVNHQKDITRQVGGDCRQYDLPFVLELVNYPFLPDEEKDNATFARRKPKIVKDYVEEFSRSEYGVDILKVEFPANLKFAKEYCQGEFDGVKREALYNLSEIKDFCREVTALAGVPWVILSAGVDIDEFVENVRIATESGASGFLGGRAIWQGSAQYYPDKEAMEEWLSTSGVSNFKRLFQVFQAATPYFEHKRFKGYPEICLEKKGADWYKQY